MKKYILIILATIVIDVVLTALVAWLAPYSIYNSEFLSRLCMGGVLIVTTLLVYLIFKKKYSLKLYGAFVFTVVIENILKFIAHLIDNDFSTVHLLLIAICICYIIGDEKHGYDKVGE